MYLQKLIEILTSVLGESKPAYSSYYSSDYFRHAAATPLTVLGANLERLNELETKIDDSLLRSSNLALTQLSQLVSDFHTIQEQRKKISLFQELQDIAGLLDSKRSSIQVISMTENTEFECANPVRVKEVFVCLVKNALEANQGWQTPVLILIYRRKKSLCVTIQDFGVGMNIFKKWLAKLTYISFKKAGTGIGLSYASQIVERELQGTVTIISKSGFRPVVECLLPMKS